MNLLPSGNKQLAHEPGTCADRMHRSIVAASRSAVAANRQVLLQQFALVVCTEHGDNGLSRFPLHSARLTQRWGPHEKAHRCFMHAHPSTACTIAVQVLSFGRAAFELLDANTALVHVLIIKVHESHDSLGHRHLRLPPPRGWLCHRLSDLRSQVPQR